MEYPFTRDLHHTGNCCLGSKKLFNDPAEVKKVVQICLDSRNHCCGDVADLITQDLLLPIGEPELAMLPKM